MIIYQFYIWNWINLKGWFLSGVIIAIKHLCTCSERSEIVSHIIVANFLGILIYQNYICQIILAAASLMASEEWHWFEYDLCCQLDENMIQEEKFNKLHKSKNRIQKQAKNGGWNMVNQMVDIIQTSNLNYPNLVANIRTRI